MLNNRWLGVTIQIFLSSYGEATMCEPGVCRITQGERIHVSIDMSQDDEYSIVGRIDDFFLVIHLIDRLGFESAV